MKNKQSGQALIEFIIILPVIILLIFSFVDLGRIVLENNRLEGLTTIVLDEYNKTKDYDEVIKYIDSLGYKNVNVSISNNKDTLTIKITKNIDIVTPGLGKIIGNPYQIKIERAVRYEE